MKRNGYTLIEVAAAAVILMLAANIIALGASASSRMERRTRQIEEAGRTVRNGSGKIPAELSIRLSDSEEPLTGNGYVYRETTGYGEKSITIWSVWTEFSEEAGPEAEE